MPTTATSTAVEGASANTAARRETGERIHSCTPLAAVGATQSTEVRWFVPGCGPSLDGARIRSRIDSYCSAMLADGVSVKSRVGHGAGVFVKLRRAVLVPVAVGDLRGTPETWARWELAALPRTSAEVHVHKVVARRKGVEVAHLVVNDEPWWTVAVRVRGAELPYLPFEIEAHLNRSGDVRCCSYSTWLGHNFDSSLEAHSSVT